MTRCSPHSRLLLLLALLSVAPAAHAQQESPQEYGERFRMLMYDFGKGTTYDSLLTMARSTEMGQGLTQTPFWEAYAGFRIAALVVQGYRPDDINRLRQQGVDVLAATLRPAELQTITDQTAVSDVVAVARITGCTYDDTARDNLYATVTFTVEETIKGAVDVGDFLHLRQMGSVPPPPGRSGFISSVDIGCEVGRVGLVFLSNALYRVLKATRNGGVRASELGDSRFAARYRRRGTQVWAVEPTFDASDAAARQATQFFE